MFLSFIYFLPNFCSLFVSLRIVQLNWFYEKAKGAMWSLVCSVQLKITEWKKLWNTKIKWFDSNTYTHTHTLIRRFEVINKNQIHHTYVQIETTTIAITTPRNEITHLWLWYVCINNDVRMYVCMRNDDVLIVVYAVNIVDTLYKKDIIYFHCRVPSFFFSLVLGQWIFIFGVFTTGYLSVSLSFDLAWLPSAKTHSFLQFVFDVIYLGFFFFTDVKTMFFSSLGFV